MRILGSLNLKGGTGKTTSSWALGNVFSQYLNKKILLVDIDPSANLTAFFRQAIEKGDDFVPNIKDCLEGSKTAEEVIRQFAFARAKGETLRNEEGEIVKQTKNTFYTEMMSPIEGESIEYDGEPTRTCFIDLLPGSKQLGALSDIDEMTIANLLAPVKDNYDLIIIDFPPEIIDVTVPGMFAVDGIIVPIEPSPDALEGLTNILGIYDEINDAGHKVDIVGIFFTRAKLNETVQRETVDEVNKMFEGQNMVIKSPIKQSSLTNKCRKYGLLPGILDPGSSLTKDYLTVAKALLKRL